MFSLAPKGQRSTEHYSVTRLSGNHEQFKLSFDILVGNENILLTLDVLGVLKTHPLFQLTPSAQLIVNLCYEGFTIYG